MSERKWFREDMTEKELHRVLFSIPRGEYKKNKESIRKEYNEVYAVVIEREIERALQGELD